MTEERIKEHMCRVVFLGLRGAGKTSVVSRLTGNKEILQQTDSVVVFPWDVTYRHRALRLECVDFGISVNDKLFRCFYTPGTLYVVVCSPYQGNYQKHAQDWLLELEQFAFDCPVIVLLNVDTEQSVCEHFMAEDLKNCNTRFREDAETREHHFRVAAKMPVRSDSRSDSVCYADTLDRLDNEWETMRNDLLFQAYLLRSDGVGRVPELPFQDLCRMALGLGQLMDGWKTANPTAAVPAIIKRGDAEAILNAESRQRGYTPFTKKETNELLRCLTEREVFFRIPSAQRGREEVERLLIPDNLPRLLSDDARNKINRNFYGNPNTLHYQCEVKPKIPRYILPLMLNENIGTLETDCIWKYGAVFQSDSGKCRALAEIHGNRMDIWVYSQGDRKEHNEYLMKLRTALTKCLSEKLSNRQWEMSDDILFAETVREDGTSTTVDCKVNYEEALENFQKGKPIYVEALRKNMDPGVILHQRSHTPIVDRFNDTHDWLEPFRKLAENLEAAETTVSGAKGIGAVLKAVFLWLLKWFLK